MAEIVVGFSVNQGGSANNKSRVKTLARFA
jgi:hypothetical protein